MLRKLYKSDLSRLLAIERASHVSPWTEETFKSCFQPHCPGWVIEQQEVVVGFIICAMSSDECHILNLCVERAHQQQGLGRRLLEQLLLHAKEKGIKIVYLEVRPTNSRAIRLYEGLGFQRVGERKAYYPTVAGREDALVFAKSLIS